ARSQPAAFQRPAVDSQRQREYRTHSIYDNFSGLFTNQILGHLPVFTASLRDAKASASGSRPPGEPSLSDRRDWVSHSVKKTPSKSADPLRAVWFWYGCDREYNDFSRLGSHFTMEPGWRD